MEWSELGHLGQAELSLLVVGRREVREGGQESSLLRPDLGGTSPLHPPLSLVSVLPPSLLSLLPCFSSGSEHLGRRRWPGWRSKPSLHTKGVRSGQGSGEAGEEVEAANQQGCVAQGGDGGRRGVIECQGGGAAPRDVDQSVVTWNSQMVNVLFVLSSTSAQDKVHRFLDSLFVDIINATL